MLFDFKTKEKIILPYSTGRKTCCCTSALDMVVIAYLSFLRSGCVHSLGVKLGSEILLSFIASTDRQVFRGVPLSSRTASSLI